MRGRGAGPYGGLTLDYNAVRPKNLTSHSHPKRAHMDKFSVPNRYQRRAARAPDHVSFFS
jgi:hypothetical protein